MRDNLKVRFGTRMAGFVLPLLILSTAPPPAFADTAPTPRQLVQHLLRRFGYSASPAQVSQVLAEGIPAWLTQQLNWSSIDDSKSMLSSANHWAIMPYNWGNILLEIPREVAQAPVEIVGRLTLNRNPRFYHSGDSAEHCPARA